ncbi:UV DNA damage repair endonuclease UvsE [Paenibacillus herberti]|uniref:UV damage repair endonuclease UvsE n=1 Tax=Paenibacillus herberti TaxID=1619309 RepID=A0A229NVR1_9BACL|nr:UV DNA damage repair endonuclease UvsE [Paenibacillus herberti]OXM14023.1 UV damage repair endonuclease UvsE [Paenibacillus herberti]
MIVRFGFVAMSLLLENVSPSRTMTYKNFSKLEDREAALARLERIAEDNLQSTLRILKNNRYSDFHLYRFSSKLIPLATHDALKDWNPYPALGASFAQLGEFVQKHGMRVSFHPDHFCVFSTPRPEVLAKSQEDMEHHVRMLEAMGLDERYKCNIHVGGAYGDKPVSGERFIRQFGALDASVRGRVTLENDDKTFNVRETLDIAEQTGNPMVLDIHHHWVNDGGETAESLHGELWSRIAATWQREQQRLGLDGGPDGLPPKIHASSPKSLSDRRGHADYVETGPLLEFLRSVKDSVPQIDCMLEAKAKDKALTTLMEELGRLADSGEGIRIIDGSTIEL